MTFNNIFLIIFCILLSFSSSAQGHKDLYSELMEPGSKLISSGYNYTLEKLDKGKFVYKIYYIENRQITHFVTYTSKSRKVKNGPYFECYDDGTILHKGHFVNNIKDGEWIEGEVLSGRYVNGKKEGVWIRKDSDNKVLSESSYKNGLLDGISKSYDSSGQIISESVFKDDVLISSIPERGEPRREQLPQYPGCEYVSEENERSQCKTRQLLLFLSKNTIYPEDARRNNIQGTALVEYVIDKDGTVSDVNVRRGISADIKAECYRVMSLMPNWEPGRQDDRAVKVKLTLPINFQLY